jgi:polyisoprenoid-binding protein YceI
MRSYLIDPRRGRFTVKAFAEGALSILGHSPTLAAREFSGRLDFDEDAPSIAILKINVSAKSLEVADEVSKRDRDEIQNRTRTEVLEVDSYPEMAFFSTSVDATKIGDKQYRLQVHGQFLLHGVQREQVIELQLRAGEADARLRGELRIKQSDFQIQRISALGGAIRVRDELLISFELLAKRMDT